MITSLDQAAQRLAAQGLVCVRCAGSQPIHGGAEVLVVIRPASVDGTPFPGDWSAYGGAANVTVRTSAPPAELWLKRSRRSKVWIVDISVPAAPGPGPVYFHEQFPALDQAVSAIVDCFFGNRVNFQNESLASWGRSVD
jgi:hypothetical protein